jgi:hypothetical protein
VNGLSDHDAQLLLLNNYTARVMNGQHYFKCHINGMNIEDFKFRLSHETWDDIFTDGDVDEIFNSFLNNYLRVFNSSFPFRRTFYKYDNKAWLTVEIRNLCHHKRNLHILCRNIASPASLAYYKRYSKILIEIRKTAKRTYYSNLIVNSDNKNKTMWNIVKTETGKHNSNHDPVLLIKDGKRLTVVFK